MLKIWPSCRGREVCGKCGPQDPDHHIIECELPDKCASSGGDHSVYARSCDSWKLEKEILAIKHKNNVPYHEARKMVAECKTTAYSLVVQRRKAPHKKYEEIVKTLIHLEPDDLESFINELHLNLKKSDTTRNSETRDHAANEYKSSAQTQTPMEKIDQEEKTAIPPPTRLIKSPIKKSPSKIR